MTSYVHEFDAREGGSFRVSLTYEAQAGTGKTTAHTDTYHGQLREARAERTGGRSRRVRDDISAMSGEMTITTTLVDADGGTDILVVYEGLPRGCRPPTTRPARGWPCETRALVEAG